MGQQGEPSLSAREFQTLADLIPRKKPPVPRLSRLIQPMRDVLAPKWVRDFLFTESPIHIQHLSAPTLPMTSLTCFLECIGVERNSFIPRRFAAQNECYNNHGYMLLTPAFTANHTTVGVGVMHTVSRGTPFAEDASGMLRLNLRFARDARTRTLVIVLHCHQDMYHISATRIEKPTRFNTFNGLFSSSLRTVALREEKELLLQHITPTIILAQEEIQARTCTICAAPPHPGCNCELPFERPGHPFDSDYFLRGMAYHIGSTQNVASRMMFASGKPHGHTVLGARVTFHGVLNADIVRIMSRWSIREHARTVKQDPLQSLLLNGSGTDAVQAANAQARNAHHDLLLDAAPKDTLRTERGEIERQIDHLTYGGDTDEISWDSLERSVQSFTVHNTETRTILQVDKTQDSIDASGSYSGLSNCSSQGSCLGTERPRRSGAAVMPDGSHSSEPSGNSFWGSQLGKVFQGQEVSRPLHQPCSEDAFGTPLQQEEFSQCQGTDHSDDPFPDQILEELHAELQNTRERAADLRRREAALRQVNLFLRKVLAGQ